MSEKKDFWEKLETVRKQYTDGLITKIQYLVAIVHHCNNEIIEESNILYRDQWKLEKIIKEVNKENE